MSHTDQAGFDVRFEWGSAGVAALAACGTFIIVDILSFSTCVSIATERGAAVLPCGWEDDQARALADREGAVIAQPREVTKGYSLSPGSLRSISRGTRLVLPSPNGAALSRAAAAYGRVLAGSLRNRTATARRAERSAGPVAVIAAGERWPDGSLRPCLEDYLGAGAVIAQLSGSRSPEAAAAALAFSATLEALGPMLLACSTGRELAERGFRADVQLAADLDVSSDAAELRDTAYVAESA